MTTKELTENPQEAVQFWPNTTWKGFSVHKDIYQLIQDEIEPMLTELGHTFQECYLAYLDPFRCGDDDNGFIVGWDIWTAEGFTSAYYQFDVVVENKELKVERLCNLDFEGLNKCGGFYDRNNGAYNLLKSDWGGLVELRLD